MPQASFGFAIATKFCECLSSQRLTVGESAIEEIVVAYNTGAQPCLPLLAMLQKFFMVVELEQGNGLHDVGIV